MIDLAGIPKTQAGTPAAPFPYFGGKSGAVNLVWELFGGDVRNYVEPFAGSLAMLLGAPYQPGVTTVNDRDGFISNFWRAVAADPDEVAHWADWPVNESDLFARHAWLVRQREGLELALHNPEFYDAKIAGWWCWGACNWIGSGWCAGTGPWAWSDDHGQIVRQLPHAGDAGQGITRKLPHASAGRGINRKLPHAGDAGRGKFIADWFNGLHGILRDTRVMCGDWSRVLTSSVTTRHGLTAVFLDPPYDKGAMDYGAGGMGEGISAQVRAWCAENGTDPKLRIVLCGHAGEHDELLAYGWRTHQWAARKGYALTDEAVANSKSETVWASPYCIGGCLA